MLLLDVSLDTFTALSAFKVLYMHHVSSVAIVNPEKKLVANLSATDLRGISKSNLDILCLDSVYKYLEQGVKRSAGSVGKEYIFFDFLDNFQLQINWKFVKRKMLSEIAWNKWPSFMSIICGLLMKMNIRLHVSRWPTFSECLLTPKKRSKLRVFLDGLTCIKMSFK